MKTEAAWLAGVKEQILIRYLGMGWVKAHHPWSSTENDEYSSKQLLKWLIDTAIPSDDTEDEPNDAPVSMPGPPDMKPLGTTSTLAEELKAGNKDTLSNFQKTLNKKREERMSKGKRDKLDGMKMIIILDINKQMKGFQFEMVFKYPNELEGGTSLDWTHGIVQEVIVFKTITICNVDEISCP